MGKMDIELLDKFKQIEEKFLSELKSTELDIDYNADSKVIVAKLKSYIKRVKNIEKILEEYEAISNKIERVMENDKYKNVASAVVDMREDSEELKAEIQNINGQVMVNTKKKKKSNNAKIREF